MQFALQIEQFTDYMLALRRKATAMKYRDGAIRFLGFLSKNGVRFDKMPVNVLSLFSEHLIHAGMKPSSVGVYVAGAKRFLIWSKNRGETNLEVSSHVDLPRVVNLPPNALKQEHLLAFFALAARLPEPKRSALLLLPFCGLRSKEFLSLTLNSVSKIRTRMPSDPTKTVENLCLTVEGKGGDVRVVPLLPDGIPILVSYLQNWRRHISGRHLFVYANGKPIPDRTIRHALTQICKKLKLERFTAHTLRRTYLTALQRAGMDHVSITKIAGHKSFQTTLNHYLEIHPEDLVQTMSSSGARLIENSDYAKQVDQASVDALSFLKNRN
jgi:site-specific recombinase XerD